MTYEEVIAALRAARPGVGLAESASVGRSRRLARGLTFRPVTDTTYRADGPGGKPVWVFVNARYPTPGKICCGERPL